ncbi:MAG: VanW family protein [Lachnospiraceae bacterium]
MKKGMDNLSHLQNIIVSGKKMRLFLLAFLLLIFVCGQMLYETGSVHASDVIYNGVFIGPVNVSGMTREQALEAVNQYVQELQTASVTLVAVQEHEVEAAFEEFGMSWNNPDVVDEAFDLVTEGNVVARYKAMKDIAHNGLVLPLDITFDQVAISNFIQINCSPYDEEVQNASLTRENGEFQIVGGEPGEAVDVVASAEMLSSELFTDYQNGEKRISLVITEITPEGDAQELALVKDILGTFTTSYSSSGYNRSCNVANGCRLVNGVTIYPGEEFSFYDTVKPFTEANGYYLAGSYMNGQVVDSFGGGICQVSTTLYNAVLLAELDVTERYPHSMVVSYVNRSADAAIAESSGKDFKFVNNTDYPIYIEGITEDKNITFTIYGVETRPASHSVCYESEILSETVPDYEEIIADPNQGVGYVSTSSAHIGYTARLWKITYENGEEVSREQVNSSSYKATPRTAVVGVNTANPDSYNQIMAAIATGSIDTCKAVAAQLLAVEQAAAAAAQPVDPQPQAPPVEPDEI